ncbi:hypothetical protein D3C86_1008710 [compost metagenome]
MTGITCFQNENLFVVRVLNACGTVLIEIKHVSQEISDHNGFVILVDLNIVWNGGSGFHHVQKLHLPGRVKFTDKTYIHPGVGISIRAKSQCGGKLPGEKDVVLGIRCYRKSSVIVGSRTTQRPDGISVRIVFGDKEVK